MFKLNIAAGETRLDVQVRNARQILQLSFPTVCWTVQTISAQETCLAGIFPHNVRFQPSRNPETLLRGLIVPGPLTRLRVVIFQCFCGPASDDFDKHGELPIESCDMLCKANPDEFCGGKNALEVRGQFLKTDHLVGLARVALVFDLSRRFWLYIVT